jgi:hypothetical protein
MSAHAPIEALHFLPGRLVAGRYEVMELLGAGWEGEAYLVRERATGIERAAKFFLPQRNPGDRTALRYAQRLHRLRHCPWIISYHARDTVRVRGVPVTFVVSDYIEGERLTDYIERQPGKRLDAFRAMHLLNALTTAIECIHRAGEYHGDLHTDNVIVERTGLTFEIKLLDLFTWHGAKKESMRHDIVETIRVFYDALGGQRCYARQPPEVKAICRGMRRDLILERFRTAHQLLKHLESFTWG